MTSVTIPDDYRDLLERPLFAHLATVRPDGTAQVNPMWFKWDGELLYFTHTAGRQKHRNVSANPTVSISVNDPDQPYKYLEVRGTVERIDRDPEGDFFVELAERYEAPFGTNPPPDAADRVVIVVRPTATSKQ